MGDPTADPASFENRKTTATGGPSAADDVRSRLAGQPDLSPSQAVDLAASDQVDRWRRQERIPVEAYLALHPHFQDDDAAFELIYSEFVLREEIGDRPTLDEYLWRFPHQAARLRRQIALDRAFGADTASDFRDADTAVGEPDDAADEPEVARSKHWPILPGYEILEELGRGGMGVVYKARQARLQRVVAIKMILAGQYASTEAVARFLAEAETVARIQHPNIVQIYDLGDRDDHAFFVMEYVEGRSLADRLDGAPRPAKEAAALLATLARAIHEAHRLGIVHRDLKPANILMTTNGTPKVADFGVAKLLDRDEGLTKTEVILGSPSYMAPEQAEGKHHDIGPAADLYALGAILYELLTGRPPFRAATLLQTLEQVRSAEPVPPSQLQPGLPRDIETICMACLRKEPARRYATAEALAEDLRRFAANEPILARPLPFWEVGWRWGERNRAVAALSAAFLLALVAGLAGVTWKWRDAVSLEIRAVEAKEEADRSKKVAIDTRNVSRFQSAEVTADRALDFARGKNPAAAMLWMVEALRASPETAPDQQGMIRRNLTALGDQVQDLRQILLNRAPLGSVAIDAEGRTVLTGGVDGVARFWDVLSGRQFGPAIVGKGSLEAVSLHPQGHLAFLGGGREGRLIDVESRKPVGPPMTHPGNIFRSAFDREGTKLVTTWRGNSALFWDGKTGRKLDEEIRTDEKDLIIWCAGFRPDGRFVIVGLANPKPPVMGAAVARIWDVEQKAWTNRILPHDGGGVLSASYSPDGKTILTGCADGYAYLWEAETGILIRRLLHPLSVEPAAFSPDGRVVVTGCHDQTVRLWDAATGRLLSSTIHHEGNIWALDFSRNGLLVTGSNDTTARVWKLKSTDQVNETQPASPGAAMDTIAFPIASRIPTVSYSVDGSKVALGTTGGAVSLHDAATGRPIGKPLQRDDGMVQSLAINRDGSQIATGGTRGKPVIVWDLDSGAKLAEVPNGSFVGALKFSPDGQTLAISREDGVLELIDLRHYPSGTREFVVRRGINVSTADFDPGGSRLAIGVGGPPSVAVWEWKTGKTIPTPKLQSGGIGRIAFRPDGKAILALLDQKNWLWNAETGELLCEPFGVSPGVHDACFTPSGETVLTWQGGIVRRWDSNDGHPLSPEFRHTDKVTSVAEDPTGRYLAVVCLDGSFQLWDLATSRPIGLPIPLRSPLLSIVCLPGGRAFSTVTADGGIATWPIPEPRPDDVDQLELRIQVETGFEIDAGRTVAPLRPEQWQELHRRLQETSKSAHPR